MTGVARVTFQNNPYSNGAVNVNIGTWTYGNYGGLGWTGGQFTPPDKDPNTQIPALDKLDEIFMNHDLAYGKTKGLSDYQRVLAIMAADKAMLDGIDNMLRDAVISGQKLGPDLVLAAVMAQKAFETKRVADIVSLVGKIPLHLDADAFVVIPSAGGNEALITALQSQFQNALTVAIDPLVLDLDGDGVETTTLSKTSIGGVNFNLDAKGLAEKTGWVGKDDGLLVRDLDGDGQITSGRELFGNHTLLQSGKAAAHGFEALKELDGNADGVVDAKDSAFAALRVWKDADSDGVTDAGELLTLDEAGVKSLKVSYTNANTIDAQGNAHRQLGSFETTAGATRAMNDVWFGVDTARSLDQDVVAVNANIAALPELAVNDAHWRQAA
jgi:hypothetical protein